MIPLVYCKTVAHCVFYGPVHCTAAVILLCMLLCNLLNYTCDPAVCFMVQPIVLHCDPACVYFDAAHCTTPVIMLCMLLCNSLNCICDPSCVHFVKAHCTAAVIMLCILLCSSVHCTCDPTIVCYDAADCAAPVVLPVYFMVQLTALHLLSCLYLLWLQFTIGLSVIYEHLFLYKQRHTHVNRRQ